ncbi:MAG: hypothetical protein ACI9XR_002673, partial [Flavobacterium sp.]
GFSNVKYFSDIIKRFVAFSCGFLNKNNKLFNRKNSIGLF